MKYIFITYSGLSLPIAYKLQQEGNDVVVGQIDDIKEYVIEEEVKRAVERDFNRERRMKLFKNMLKIQPADRVIESLISAKNPQEYFVFLRKIIYTDGRIGCET